MKTLPLIPYIRQSRKKEQTISLDDQRAAITAWAHVAGVTLGAEVVEQGVSGSKDWKTRELGAAIKAVQEGRAAGIVVAYQSRLSRESGLGTAEVWEALEKASARLVCVTENIDTARGGEEEFSFGINAVIARREWKRHAKNWQSADKVSIENAVYQGSTPVGYAKGDRTIEVAGTNPTYKAKQLRVLPEAVPTIRRVFELRANGASWADCGKTLEAAGIKTATGDERWGLSSIRSLICNRIYAGEMSNGHQHRFSEYAMVTNALWTAAQPKQGATAGQPLPDQYAITYSVTDGITRKETDEYREARSERRARGGSNPGKQATGQALLGGLVRCAGCGHTMATNTTYRKDTGQTYRYMKCNQLICDAKATVRGDAIEEIVWNLAVEFHVANGPTSLGDDADAEAVAALEITADEARKRFQAWEQSSDPLDPGYADRKVALRDAILEADRAVANEASKHAQPISETELRAAYDTGTPEQKRVLIRQALAGGGTSEPVTISVARTARGEAPVVKLCTYEDDGQLVEYRVKL